jgi:hypothetical protein
VLNVDFQNLKELNQSLSKVNSELSNESLNEIVLNENLNQKELNEDNLSKNIIE